MSQSVSESRIWNEKLALQLQKHSVLKANLAPKVHFALKIHSTLEVHAVKLKDKFFTVGLSPPPPLQNKQVGSTPESNSILKCILSWVCKS